jgi:hypothetical protein
MTNKTEKSGVLEVWNEYEPLEHHFRIKPKDLDGFAIEFRHYEEFNCFANQTSNLLRKVSLEFQKFEASNESTFSMDDLIASSE